MNEGDCGPLEPVVAFAPARVNLIGDHTDYTGGFAMPIAAQLGTEVTYHADPSSACVELSSSREDDPARVPLSIPEDPFEIAMLLPEWSRFVAGVVALVRPRVGGKGNISSDVPVGAGLSSSASLEIAVALALGHDESTLSLAQTCQQAEHLANGVPTGILDQLAITSAWEGHAMLLDCESLEVRQVQVPGDSEIVVIHCGITREVATSAYAERQRQCAAAEHEIGSLRQRSAWEVDRIRDPLVRRRARHVVSENSRVLAFAGALEHADLRQAGNLMNDSHRSLAIDFEVSIRELDELVTWLQSLPDVFGARLTGAGFGGCAVALARPGVLSRLLNNRNYWIMRPSAGARLR